MNLKKKKRTYNQLVDKLDKVDAHNIQGRQQQGLVESKRIEGSDESVDVQSTFKINF